jgi:hypothetical protein
MRALDYEPTPDARIAKNIAAKTEGEIIAETLSATASPLAIASSSPLRAQREELREKNFVGRPRSPRS